MELYNQASQFSPNINYRRQLNPDQQVWEKLDYNKFGMDDDRPSPRLGCSWVT